MKIRSRATRLGALVGAAAVVGGLGLLSLGAAGVGAQAPATTTATAAAVVATPSGPTPASNVGGPSSVPSARFYGSVTANGVAAATGATVTASIGGVACGFGTVSAGQYVVDVQYIQGCTNPGSTVSFTVNGLAASPTGTLPAIEGTAVNLNLTVAAATPTATPPPPPPPPPPTATRAPTTAPTERPTASPTRPPTVAPTAPPTVTQQGAQKPSAQKPSGPAAQKPSGPAAQKPYAAGAQQPYAAGAQRPGAAAAAPAARPALPNTGTGGLLGSQSQTETAGLLVVLFGALTLGLSGLALSRRGR